MVKRTPRRPSSASPTSRPRRIAGQGGPAQPETPDTPAGVEPDPVVAEVEPEAEPEPEPEEITPDPAPEADHDEPDAPDVADDGLVGSPRTTRVLLVAIVAFAVLALAGGIFLWVDDEPSTATDTGSGSGPADAETPVRITGKDAQVAVAAAAQAAYTIVATSYKDYDAQIDEAAKLMTPSFAKEYRQTAEDAGDAIVSSKTEVQVSVVAQGVVRADQEEVEALVFLNQFVTKNGKKPVYTPYRVLVTVVNTDQGWLVSDLETK